MRSRDTFELDPSWIVCGVLGKVRGNGQKIDRDVKIRNEPELVELRLWIQNAAWG